MVVVPCADRFALGPLNGGLGWRILSVITWVLVFCVLLDGARAVIKVDAVHLAGGDVLKRLAALAFARLLLVLDDIPKHLTG